MSSITEAATPYPGTGPYRRIWTQTGFAAMRATVYLPGVAQGGIVAGQADDTSFVYGGGWGSEAQALDAGFMHNPVTDSWSLVIQYQGQPYLGDTPQIRLKPDQTVTFTVSIPVDGSILVETAGEAIEVLGIGNVNDLGYQTFSLPFDGAVGFLQSGSGVVLKRMTSIGQKKGAQKFNSGSKLVGVVWSDVQFGLNKASLVPWSITAPGGTMEYTSAVVSVAYVNDTYETVSIVL